MFTCCGTVDYTTTGWSKNRGSIPGKKIFLWNVQTGSCGTPSLLFSGYRGQSWTLPRLSTRAATSPLPYICGEHRHTFILLYTFVSARRREDQNFRWDGKPDPPRTASVPIRNSVRNSSLTEKCMLLDTLDRLCDEATSQQEDIVTTAAVLEASICSKYT
jgi:hypothetical protein